MSIVITLLIFSSTLSPRAFAGNQAFDFGVSGDYSLSDNTKIEVVSNTSRLKSQQYATDGSTAGLWHFDESEGAGAETAADDVSTNNNDGTFGTTSPCNSDGGAFGSGKINNDVTLPGTPNCLTVPDSASLSFSGANPAVTAEALVRFPNAFDATADIRQSIFDKGNYRMFFSESDGKLKFELHGASTSKTWNKVGGANTTNITTTEGLNGSWRQYLPGTVQVIQEYNSALYIGTAGPTVSGGTAEVWKYTSGTSWTKVAGDGVLNDQWDNINFESVQSMAVFSGKLYIGLGFSTGDGEIWAYTDSPESLVRARSFTSIEEVDALAVDGSTAIYAGLGNTASDADVWSCSTTCTTSGNWTQIGGNEVNATKPNWNTGYERVRSMVVHGGKLFVGLGDTAAEAEVWRYDTTTWTKVGGDGVGSTASWATADNIEYVSALASDGTNLYAGTGLTAGDADVWVCTANCTSGTPSWTKIGGDGINTSWAAATFETVRGLTVISSRLYASIGDSTAEAEVWRYDNPNWTKIGGDGVNTTWDNSFSAAGTANVKEQAFVGSFGTDLIAGTGTTSQDAEVWRCTANCSTGTPTWSWIGGRDFNSWGPAQMSQVGTMTIHNGYLYIGFGTTNKHAVLWQYNGTTWTQVGGGGIQGSNWELYEFIRGSTTFDGKLYVGMGDTTTDADVWEWDGATWTKMGGDGLSGSWNTNYEYVSNLVNDGTYMYAGLGSGAGDAEIYKYDPGAAGNKWSKIGGDTANNWSTTREHAWQMAVYGNLLYVGLGLSGTLSATPATCRAGTDGEVWRYNGTSDNWTQLGGDGLNSGWDCSATEAREGVYSMTFLEDKLYVGLGNTADEGSIGDGEVWECTDCINTGVSPTWTKVGGDNANSGWNDTDYEWVNSMIAYNGDLYAGLGNEAGDAELWRYYDHDNDTGTAKIWGKIGGDGVGTPASWSTNYETINGLTVYRGRLYAGLGNTNNTTTPSDGEVWEYGGNNVIYAASAKNSWTANTWYHVAAVYNGTDAKLYVDGVQDGDTVTGGVTMADNTKTLTIGSLKGPLTSDGPYGGFSGEIDELRISSSARTPSSFVQTQYVTTGQTVRPTTAVSRSQKHSWSGFAASEGGVGTIAYRLSDDNAATWKYYTGGAWTASSTTAQANPVATVNTNIPTFPVTSSGLVWQAILTGNGDQQVTLNSVTVSYIDDTTAPNNVSDVTGNANSGSWFDRANPQFSWSAPTDPVGGGGELASGIKGYWVYFGTNAGADPSNDGVFQAGTSYSGTPIASGDTQAYYFRIETQDNALNISSTIFDKFHDTVVPNNVTDVTGNETSGSWFDRANPQFSWSAPTDGTAGGGEVQSGVKGYYVYFGTNASAVPRTAGTFQTGTTFSSSPISGSDEQAYYLRIQTQDNALNTTDDTTGVYDKFRDTNPPNNVSAVAGNANSGNWFDRANPQFSWSAPTDPLPVPNTNNEVASGVKGYYVYFGTNASAVPRTAGTFVTTTTYTGTPISGSDTQSYYFRIQTRDKALNTTSDSTGIFDAFRDTTPPNNVSSVTALSAAGGSPISQNTWYNYTAPEFSWSAATDQAAPPGEVQSGVAGYYVYFGTNASALPRTSGTFQTGTTFVPSNMVSGQTYYLRLQTRDSAFNTTSDVSGILDAFTYKIDTVGPTGPTVSVSPAGYTAVNDFTFFWLGSGPGSATDPSPGSGFSGNYIYRVGSNSWSVPTTDTSINIPNAAYQEGANVFEIKGIDNVGNEGPASSVTFYYSGSAPTAPQNVEASPVTSEGSPSVANAFSFSWDAPASSISPIKQYRFSVNKLPTANNTTITPFTTLSAAPFATQQGKNTFYVVAEDEAGNINYDNPGSVDFYALTPAPEPPTQVQIFDISNRDTQEYAISMKWSEPTKASGFDGYEVYRSQDGATYISAGTTRSPVFIDTNLESKLYYYKVQSKDNAGQHSIDSTVVTLTPTGRFTTAPKILDTPTIATKSFSAVIDWNTDRIGSSFIEYGKDRYHLGKQAGGETIGTLDMVTKHTVSLKGLDPETTYAYQAVWVDQDGNRGQSEILAFQTGLRPKISDVKVSGITLNSATISWTTTTVGSSAIRYGKSKSLGSSVDDSGNTGTKHTVRLEGLDDTSLYYFVIAGTDTDGNSLQSDEYSFSTLTRPIVSNVVVDPIRDAATTTLKIAWTTNVPATSVAAYGPAGSTARTKSDPEYATAHELVVNELGENTPYTIQARSVDQFGNVATSESLNITTPDDSRPPKINNLNIEVRSTGVGEAQKAQLIVTWDTDEPSTSQIEFGPGISSDSYPSRTAEDSALTNSHTVIVPELEPAKIYHLRAVSRDRAGNPGLSSDTTAITGKVQRSVIDIILGSLQRSLGFLGNLTGVGK